MNTHSRNPNIPDDDGVETPPPPPPPRDELDGLLREWHSANAAKAAAGRDRLMETLAQESAGLEQGGGDSIPFPGRNVAARITVRKILFNRFFPLAAAAVVLAVLLPFVIPSKTGKLNTIPTALASNVMMAPEGGRLEALDKEGSLMGPCALKHTDVKAEISGRFSRVTVTQEYHNPYSDKIEAVYTFPLSDRGGVDRMTMTIGDRVIVGEVKERESARRIYEQARDSGRTASLLEQERPNIFTQSVANIDPGATITIEISYVEIVAERDGELAFEFPTVVSPRYVPGSLLSAKPQTPPLPAGARARNGVVLAAPANVASATKHEVSANDPGERTAAVLGTMLAKATAIETPEEDPSATTQVWYDTEIAYPDGSKEPAVLLADGRGEVGGRWFYCPVMPPAAPGEPFAKPTDQVPDADRITPMPTRPDVRAGHDISISVTLDTGGPGIVSLDAPLHKTVRTDLAKNALEQPRRVSIALASLNEIPNRDFVLRWKQTSDTLSHRVFTNTGEHGNFFAVQLEPPARADDDAAVPRELVFVVDSSGSMNGRPMSLCRQVMQKMTDAMRPQDTFNIITFAGATKIMWERPRPNNEANRVEAQRFIETWEGSGGTEMMTAIEAALRQTPEDAAKGTVSLEQLANLPADGRTVSVVVEDGQVATDRMERGGLIRTPALVVREGLSIQATDFTLPQRFLKRADQTVTDNSVVLKLLVHGTWVTEKADRLLRVSGAEMYSDSGVRPLRIVMFLTDAKVGNDFAIIDAIKRNRATTRVFPFGIGNSVNRFLIDQMAVAGGGEPEYVYAREASDADANVAVERFNRRARTPLLTDVTVKFDGVQPLDVLPAPDNIPDLYDNRPLTFLGRYTEPGVGTVTIKGQTARGPWEETIRLHFPVTEAQNSSLPTLWARAKIDALMSEDLRGIQAGHPKPEVRAQIITLGETFSVMSQYTSFVAVDKLRITLDGRARLVRVPVELPDQTNWASYFGDAQGAAGDPAAGQSLKDGMQTDTDGAAGAQQQVLSLNEQAINELMVCSNTLAEKTKIGADESQGLKNAAKGLAPTSGSAAAALPTPPPPPAPVASAPPTVPGSIARPGGAPAEKFPATVDPNKSVAETKSPRKEESLALGSPTRGGRTEPGLIGRDLRESGAGTENAGRSASAAGNSTHFWKRYNDAGGATVGGDANSLDSISARSAFTRRGGESGLYSFGSNAAAGNALQRQLDDFAVTGETLSDTNFNLATAAAPESVVALAAAQLADSGRFDEAKSLACSNLAGDLALALRPQGGNPAMQVEPLTASNAMPRPHVQQSMSQPPISRICGALSSQLPEEEKKAEIGQARAQATAQILAARRVATVQRKLDAELLARTPQGDVLRKALATTVLADRANAKPASGAADAKTGASVGVGVKSDQAAVPAPTPTTQTQPGSTRGVLVAVLVGSTTPETLEALKAIGFTVEIVRADVSVIVGRIAPDKLETLALMEQVKRVEPVPDGPGLSVK
jgi:hypothetical protein